MMPGADVTAGRARFARSQIPAASPRAEWDKISLAAAATVTFAMVFNCALCFVATQGVHVGLPLIAGAEVAAVAAALLLSKEKAFPLLLVPGLLLGLNTAALLMFSGTTDVKILVEFAVAGGFACLGLRFRDVARANRIMWALAALVFLFGLYEMFAFDSFEHWFHVFDYYVGKGALDAQHAGDTGTTLAENGVRPEMQGRQLLGGILSLHRVGSVFLEPVSAGNFTTICAAWVFARRDYRLSGLLLLATGLAIGVLADARFAILSALAVGAFLASPLWKSRLLIRMLPFVFIAGLMIFGSLSAREVDNSVAGRLFGSGSLIDDWGLDQWLGIASDHEISMDTGYTYVIGNIGIVASTAIWFFVVGSGSRNIAATRFLAAISLYMSLSLCISASFFSIKTAAVLWFLYGVLSAARSAPNGKGLATRFAERKPAGPQRPVVLRPPLLQHAAPGGTSDSSLHGATPGNRPTPHRYPQVAHRM